MGRLLVLWRHVGDLVAQPAGVLPVAAVPPSPKLVVAWCTGLAVTQVAERRLQPHGLGVAVVEGEVADAAVRGHEALRAVEPCAARHHAHRPVSIPLAALGDHDRTCRPDAVVHLVAGAPPVSHAVVQSVAAVDLGLDLIADIAP